MLFLLAIATADAGCTLTTGPEVAPGIPSVHASCHWPDRSADAVDAVIARIGDHDDLFWMITQEDVVARDGDRLLVHQRHEVGPLKAREAHVWVERAYDGEAVVTRWHKAEVQPAFDDAIEPGDIRGSWTIAPDPEGGARVELDLAYDPAGWVPNWVVRMCQGSGARRALNQLHAAAGAAHMQVAAW